MDLHALAQALHLLPPGTLVALPREALLQALGEDGPTDNSRGAGLVDLTVAQVSELFGRAPSTIRQWLEARLLEGYKLLGREWRIPQASVSAFQERQRVVSCDHDVPAPPSGRGALLGDWRRVAPKTRPDQRRDERHD